jgi:hypothetical protein
MNGKQFITTSILAAGFMVFDGGLAWSQTTGANANDREIIHPDISSPNTSTGGTRSERTSPQAEFRCPNAVHSLGLPAR